jgi:hypothetical protein
MTISRYPSVRELHRASKCGKTCLSPQEALDLQGKSTKAFSSFVGEVTNKNGNKYIINNLFIQKGCRKFRKWRKRQLNKKRQLTWAPDVNEAKKARVPLVDLSAVTRSLDFSDEKVETPSVPPTWAPLKAKKCVTEVPALDELSKVSCNLFGTKTVTFGEVNAAAYPKDGKTTSFVDCSELFKKK